MSKELVARLEMLEGDYPGQPVVAQKADLEEINRIRARLGMSQVDARLVETGTVTPPPAPEQKAPKAAAPPDHSEARAIYARYRARLAELEPHRAYADRVARATHSPGQTPVRPLATMGTGGGQLLCDHCGKGILLEGGKFNGVTAGDAWKQNPCEGWKSWILGGMLVEIVDNGTLRIYHGYPGASDKYCCNAARKKREREEMAYASERTPELVGRLIAFCDAEFPDVPPRGREDLVNDILNTLYSYDPGIGVNRPEGA